MIDPIWLWRIIVGSVAVSLTLWATVIARWIGGRPAVLFQPRRAVPWGLVDLMTVLVVWIMFQAAAIPIVEKYYGISLKGPISQLPGPQQMIVLTAGAVCTLLALVAWLGLIRWRTGANMHDLGWSARKLLRDGYLGLVAFVMLAVPVFAVQWVLTQWLSIESKHPLVDVVLEQPRPSYLLCSGFAALIAAPIVEEYLFRVFLQGWLENVAGSFRAAPAQSDALARWSDLWVYGPQEEITPARFGEGGMAAEHHHSDVDSLRVSGASTGHPDSTPNCAMAVSSDRVGFPTRVGPATWPILVSAGLFALAHYSHGPDPVALFLLALGLGYLYQRTHRILPCIVVHFLVNAVTMLQLWLMISQPQ